MKVAMVGVDRTAMKEFPRATSLSSYQDTEERHDLVIIGDEVKDPLLETRYWLAHDQAAVILILSENAEKWRMAAMTAPGLQRDLFFADTLTSLAGKQALMRAIHQAQESAQKQHTKEMLERMQELI